MLISGSLTGLNLLSNLSKGSRAYDYDCWEFDGNKYIKTGYMKDGHYLGAMTRFVSFDVQTLIDFRHGVENQQTALMIGGYTNPGTVEKYNKGKQEWDKMSSSTVGKLMRTATLK